MSEIQLTQGLVALIDDEFFERVSQYKWWAEQHGDGWRAVGWIDGKQVLLHRFILGLSELGAEVDHISRDGLDCRLVNMRIATRSQNCANRPKFAGTYTSKYKGVSWYKNSQKWAAAIRIETKLKHLGYFVNEEDAARAYDKAAHTAWGEFAVLNFPEEWV